MHEMARLNFILELCLILIVFQQARCAIYYFSPEPVDETCNIEETCYSLRHINQIIRSSHREQLTLLLLEGRHIFPGSLLLLSNIDRLNISPYGSHSVEIECKGLSPLIWFRDIKQLNISSVNFTSCYAEITNSDDTVNSDGSRHPNFGLINKCRFHSTALACKIFHRYYLLFINDTVFINSTGKIQGGALSILNITLMLNYCHFEGNMAEMGGAIYSDSSRVRILEDTAFVNNSATNKGGAIYLLESSAEINNTDFFGNHAGYSGGALHFDNHITPERSAQDQYVNLRLLNVKFISNWAGKDGGALYCGSDSSSTTPSAGRRVFILGSTSEFNTAEDGGFVFLSQCLMKVLNTQESCFLNNRASRGGAVYAHESIMDFGSEASYLVPTYISNNTAERMGGAMFLNRTLIPLYNPFTVIFEHNFVISELVEGKGGAIFINDSDCQFSHCFFVHSARPNVEHTFFVFSDNRASLGPVLFGGLLDRCTPIEADHSTNAVEIFKQISEFGPASNSSAITSLPLKVCVCHNSQPNCSLNELSVTRMRGESVALTMAALDQDGNPVLSIVSARYRETLTAHLKQGERNTQLHSRGCTDLQYHIFASKSTNEATLDLEPSENPCRESPQAAVTIRITIAPCSRGFQQEDNTCVCDRRLTQHFNISACNISALSVQRRGAIWLRYDDRYLKAHPNCPLDYCQVDSQDISLSSPDDQCSNNRSGVLCGGCRANFSIALGGSKCKACTTSYNFAWLMVIFALMGLALVALLLICNVTISAGTLNGLIFYANVVSTSGLTTLQSCSLHPILSVFIAWVNLDFGVETCFYSGLDTYQKTWLQYGFPLYVWLLVGAVIVVSHYSSLAMKLFGRNNVAILATLFLLSYSKLLKTIVTSLSVTQVLRSSADNVSDQLMPYRVWTYDGNVDFLRGRHIALFVVALLLLLFLFLPYTLLLTFGQCLRSARPGRRWRWLLRVARSTAFVSILDAYHAPYNTKHRYWTGLMLLARCVLLLVFATSSTQDDVLANAFTITLAVMGILIVKTFVTKVYRVFHIEVLELSFLLNLGATSATVYYLRGGSGGTSSICITTTASISFSFIMFIGILLYHACLRIRKMKCFTSIKSVFKIRKPTASVTSTSGSTPANSKLLDSVNLTNLPPTVTTIDLREQLLESVH